MAPDAWTLPRLARVPEESQLKGLADRMRACWDSETADLDASALVGALGWRFRMCPVGSPSSTVESLLVPLRDGGFSVVVNSHNAVTRDRMLWLAAHEIAHSFFYAVGSPPRRIIPCTDLEEQFCDRFADELLSGRRVGTKVKVA